MTEHSKIELSGILNLDKPAGWTSHDVVAKVRRILGQRSVGHAGTLDPMATGVLLVCVGQATRVAEYVMASEKVYRAVVRLGITTDTYDTTGQVTAERPVKAFASEELARALQAFTGDIQQVPPAYSAIKQDGVPMYRRARRGEEGFAPGPSGNDQMHRHSVLAVPRSDHRRYLRARDIHPQPGP